MTLKKELEEPAKSIRTRAGETATPFAEAVDALKALTTLYATFQKDKGKSEEPSDGFTMADAQATIEDNGHGSEAAVRSDRRRTRPQ